MLYIANSKHRLSHQLWKSTSRDNTGAGDEEIEERAKHSERRERKKKKNKNTKGGQSSCLSTAVFRGH